jgi:hypothetical protein
MLSSLVLVVAIGVSAYTVYGLTGGPSPLTATATVLSVKPNETHRRVYDVTFVTADGQRCASTVNSGFSFQVVTDRPNVGDSVRVRYQAGAQPCALVREADESLHPVVYVLPFVLLIVAIVVTYAAWLPVYRSGQAGAGET